MKLWHLAPLLISFQLLSGCTALGFAADMAVISAKKDDGEPSKTQELTFTQAGMQADLELIGELLGQDKEEKIIVTTEARFTPDSDFVGLCPRKLKEGEKCYSAEYYEQFRQQLDK